MTGMALVIMALKVRVVSCGLTIQLIDPAPTAFWIEEGRHRRVRVDLVLCP